MHRHSVLALRLYTTKAYLSINGPLRELASGARNEPHPLPVTVAYVAEAIKLLRTVEAGSIEKREQAIAAAQARRHSSSTPLRLRTAVMAVIAANRFQTPPSPIEVAAENKKLLWRGIRNRCVDESFYKHGGTEMAPMSTTTSLEVALNYCVSSSAVLLCLKCGNFMRQGASINYLSAFPSEAEVVFPPLTYLKLAESRDRPREFEVESRDGCKLKFTVLVVEPDI